MSETTTDTRTFVQIDPVCGMEVEAAEAAGSAEYHGRTYYFCSENCLERFQAAPGEFVSGGSHPKSRAAAVPGARYYVCPMDPEVRESEPGACPKCGMALEPDLSA